MPPQSSVITSPYRKEIEEMLIEGKSPRYISEWLKAQEPKENISHTAINNYKNNHFNVPVEAVKEYNKRQSEKRKKKATTKQVDDLEKIDQFIQNVDSEIIKKLEPKEKVQAVNQLLNTKYKILGVIDDKQSVEVNVNNNNHFDSNVQKQILDDEGSNE